MRLPTVQARVAKQREGASQQRAPADPALELREIQQRNAAQAERRGGEEGVTDGGAESDSHADRHHEHHRREEQGDEARHDDFLRPVDEVVVERDHQEPGTGEERMVASGKT
jgi:hypothetical protein